MTDQTYLTPQELTERWRGVITVGALANWRSQRVGPPFVKFRGRVLYPMEQLQAWETENMQLIPVVPNQPA